MFDEDLLEMVRNKKRKAYSSATHLLIVLPDICMLDYLATDGGVTTRILRLSETALLFFI
jgi:hypothetical protein